MPAPSLHLQPTAVARAAAAALPLLLHRGAASQAPLHDMLREVLGRGPSGPSTAATGSPAGLGNFGGSKADYDEKYTTGTLS
jgi:hypothetical protein